MSKIKLNLVSGGVVEKPLLSAFKVNEASYVVLDNELNGSMGLPIILVCKLDQNKLVKIVDQNEWQVVKEYLKNIIAGQPIEYISLPNELQADDIYYTQLTLPVPSFDALKNAYDPTNTKNNVENVSSVENKVANEPVSNVAPVNPIPDSTPINPAVEPVVTNEVGVNSVDPVSPINISNEVPVNNNPTPVELSPVTPDIATPVIPEGNVVDNPVNINNQVLDSVQPAIDLNAPVTNFTTPGPIPTTEPQNPSVGVSEPAGIPTVDPVQIDPMGGINNPIPTVDLTTPVVDTPSPVMPNVNINAVENPNPVISTPTPDPVTPDVVNNPNVVPPMATANEIVPDLNNNINPIENNNTDRFKDQKEAFMQACENMFDALVQKFEKELENR